MSLTLKDARNIIAAATKKSNELDVKMDIAVVDAGGHLIAFEKMDGAWLGSIDIAINKAFTARMFDMSTKDLKGFGNTDGVAFGIHNANQGRTVIFSGGVPLLKNGEVVGGLGISGGHADKHDHPVAEAGAAVYNS